MSYLFVLGSAGWWSGVNWPCRGCPLIENLVIIHPPETNSMQARSRCINRPSRSVWSWFPKAKRCRCCCGHSAAISVKDRDCRGTYKLSSNEALSITRSAPFHLLQFICITIIVHSRQLIAVTLPGSFNSASRSRHQYGTEVIPDHQPGAHKGGSGKEQHGRLAMDHR